jgi:hypothetical protein
LIGKDGGYRKVTTRTNEDLVQEALTIIYEKIQASEIGKRNSALGLQSAGECDER